MIVISDTGPIHYLILSGLADLLPQLYKNVVLPAAVARELSHPKAPPVVQS